MQSLFPTALLDGMALGDLENPIVPWVDLVTAAFENVVELGQNTLVEGWGAFVQQLAANWVGYGEIFATALVGAANGFASWATGSLPEALQTAFDQLMAGNVNDAVQTLAFMPLTFMFEVGFSFQPVLDIPRVMAQNFANVVNEAMFIPIQIFLETDSWLNGTMPDAFGQDAQALVDAMNAGDLAGALNTVVNFPASMVDAFLNGWQPFPDWLPDHRTPSLLNLNGVLSYFLVQLPGRFADAITPAEPEPLMSGLPAADQVPAGAAAAKSVSLTTGPEAAPAESDTGAAAGAAEQTPQAPETPPVTPVDDTETDETEETEDTTVPEDSEENTDSEEPVEPNEPESPNGATDLSDGNMTEPGDNTTGSGEDTGTTSDDESESSADGTTGDDTEAGGTSNNANTDSGDSNTGGGGSENGSDGGSES